MNARNGGQGQNRTADTRIFSPLLYRLSYLAILYGEQKRCVLNRSERVSSSCGLFSGALNSLVSSEPPPKKYFSISSSRNFRALGSIGVNLFSLINGLMSQPHPPGFLRNVLKYPFAQITRIGLCGKAVGFLVKFHTIDFV